jgi:ABC-2 type transport system permease protein
VSELRRPSSAAMVRLVAAREASTRLRDKNFVIGSIVIVVLLLGIMGMQVASQSGGEEARVGIVGETGALESALRTQGDVLDVDVTVVPLDDEAAAGAAVEDGDVDAAVVGADGDRPELLLSSSDGRLEALVGGAVTDAAVGEQLAEAGVQLTVPQVTVTTLDEDDREGQATTVAVVGVAMLYGLLILFAQFVAQGVVEEKSSRVVELLLATMKPWQLLAGKILGLGLLGLGQIVVIGVLGVGGALAFDLVDVPGDLIGTVVSVIAWFVLGYAFYAALYAAAASLVSRQEDLGSVLTPTSMLLIAAFIIAIQASADPSGPLATVTSFVPGLSPMVMPVRMAAGEAPAWQVALSVLLMLVAIALIVRIGGRVYAGALMRTGGKVKVREVLRAAGTV